MFELETPTKARLADVLVLSQKNRQPDEDPGAKLSFEVKLTNDSLAGFDGALKSFLFWKSGAPVVQASLEGVALVSDKPNLTVIGSHVGLMHWAQKFTGYELEIDLGLGGARSNLTITDCQLGNFRIRPEEGGSVFLKFDIESADVSAEAFGKLAKLKSREIPITLFGPEVAQAGALETTWTPPPPTPIKRGPGRPPKAPHLDPTTAFLATAAGDQPAPPQ
jgi:hypothetical protein